MDASEQAVPGKSSAPVVKKFLKPIKTKLRLKKEDVRQCRLCMRVLPRADTHDTMAPGSDLCRKILDAVVVEIFSSDRVTSVCINCIMMVDIINDFRMTCRKADTLHGTKLMMLHPGSWLSDENKLSLVSCHRLLKRNRAEMDALFRCSGVNNQEIHRLTKGKEMVLEPIREPVMNFERVDVAVISKSNEEKAEMKTEENVDNGPEMSEQCGTEQDAQLEEARRMTAKKEAKMYMCELCGKLMQKMYMEEHENMHMGQKPYECTEENCNKTFGSNVVMSIHIINVHRKGQRYECETCHKSIKGLAFYNQHLQTHQATNSLKVPCKVCGKTFYKRYLRDHMFVHTGETPYKCEFCDRKFAARNNLAVHRRKQHSDKLENQG
ncbi:zinc finger protein 717-like [Ochlerotatus camptorhynchus]|uniref:zinc finger protein 717-like n=1 Tax=Ochlerotatus camptorhynchus TaxID=644619 RepID=UPI0031D4E3EF